MRKIMRIFIFILPVFIIASLILLPKKLIKIREVQCFDIGGDKCPTELESKFNQFSGRNIEDVQRLLKKYAYNELMLADYETHYKIPDILQIQVVAQSPSYAIKDKSGKIALLTENGRIMSYTDVTKLQIIETDQLLPGINSSIDLKYLDGMRIAKLLAKYHNLQKPMISQDKLSLELSNNIKAIFPLSGDTKLMVGSINLIIGRLISESEKSTMDNGARLCDGGCEVDLRYKNPIIRKLS